MFNEANTWTSLTAHAPLTLTSEPGVIEIEKLRLQVASALKRLCDRLVTTPRLAQTGERNPLQQHPGFMRQQTG